MTHKTTMNKLNKNKLGLITASIAAIIFLIGVPLRQMQGLLNFLSGLHGNTAVAVGINWKGTIIGALFVFIVYYAVGWFAGYTYERI